MFFPSTGGRRLVVLIRRTVAAAACGTNRLQPHYATFPSHCFSSAPLARTPDPDTASYLVASCGVPHAAAAAASRWVRICSTAKADAVLALLRHHGFSDAHIARLLRRAPRLLILDPDKIIRPKVEFFESLGIGAAVLAQTNLLMSSLDKHLVPCVEFLRGILGTDAKFRAAVSRYPMILQCSLEKSMRPSVEALRRHGLPEDAISQLLIIKVGVLRMPPSRIAGIFEDLEATGLPITNPQFAYGFRVISGLKRETWLRKVALFQSFGVSEGELFKSFRKLPQTMARSDESIKKQLHFLVDELKLKLSDVMDRPVLMGLSLENNILPKCAVLSVLMREGRIEQNINLLAPLVDSSKRFSEKYVLRYAKDVPDVVEAYEGKIKFQGFKDCSF
ncbi:hypothetical protein BAE44_0021548 [Dichanthelium oligosanthes]|uniref:Uncharacterized protein n=1 Tax=Dichanthelium oligosanthes TaxID=888268 RepID=A0A1E5UX26_9POAL|nr:hypothetical protein BAE44_0021548 [Dichanthelium oligosanthes]